MEGRANSIAVNDYMQTSDQDIYAIGDACSTCVFNVSHMHVITPKSRRDRVFSDQRTWVPLGGPANRQARIAVDHIFMGEKALAYPGSLVQLSSEYLIRTTPLCGVALL